MELDWYFWLYIIAFALMSILELFIRFNEMHLHIISETSRSFEDLQQETPGDSSSPALCNCRTVRL